MSPARRRMVPAFMGVAGLDVPDRIGIDRTTLLYLGAPQPTTAGTLDAPARRLLHLVDAQRGGLSVYESAAGLGLPYCVVRLMTASLASRGLLEAHDPPAPADLPDIELLEVVLNGLRAL
ncbi:DUF742 domain-containing protein [Streptomyces sp. NPDC087851]|uniref:DUF742 domain-containing protein n=1 Tax=Streptomyces sp. NPDC087851 TaxID=3365810 RepID=UPI00381EAAD4